jgi:RNA polymerase sigma-70 factor (sigma-E family)
MDQDEFSDYASARWGSLVRSAVFLGCSLEEAQDLAQTTLLRCYTSWRKVARAEDRDAYIYRILVNCLKDSRRRRWWGERPTTSLPEAGGVDPTHEYDVADAVHRALADLPKDQREVLVLRYFAHLSEQQTATALGLPAGTVKSRAWRALTRLSSNPHLADLAEGTP